MGFNSTWWKQMTCGVYRGSPGLKKKKKTLVEKDFGYLNVVSVLW